MVPRRPARGFTTVELLIAVVIVGILGAITLPLFLEQIRKGRRSDAVQALSAVQQAQERFRSSNISYATASQLSTSTGLNLSSTSPAGYYSLSITSADATSYIATATAVSGKSQAEDSACSSMAVRMLQGVVTYGSGSGPDWSDANRCWAK